MPTDPDNKNPTAGKSDEPEENWAGISDTHPIPVVPLDDDPAEVVPCLIVISGRQMGQMFRVSAKQARIGRAEDAEFCIRDTSISRHHAAVYRDPSGGCRIRDLGSTNGTFVNGRRVQDTALSAGDRIQLGKLTILKLEHHGRAENEFHAQLYEAGTRDPLTGTFNRRYIDQHLEADFSLALRHREEVSILLIDIDHFKEVNDTHGHLAGDAVLRALGSVFASRVRAEDLLARYGGEEFVLVLRHTSLQGAIVLAEALRQRIEAAEFKFKGNTIKLTISIGLAALEHPAAFKSAKDLLAAADKALYCAKNAGRNRVEVNGMGEAR